MLGYVGLEVVNGVFSSSPPEGPSEPVTSLPGRGGQPPQVTTVRPLQEVMQTAGAFRKRHSGDDEGEHRLFVCITGDSLVVEIFYGFQFHLNYFCNLQ